MGCNSFKRQSAASVEGDRWIYWLDWSDFESAREQLALRGYRVVEVGLTPCQVLKAKGSTVVYCPPRKWDGFCNRQGSWYRASHRKGQYMLVSDHELPCSFAPFLDSHMSPSEFEPERLPQEDELRALVHSPEYESAKPEGWETISRLDHVLLKLMMTVTRFWRFGDNLARHWLGHRANHANFLSRRFTTRLDGEDVAYSVTQNGGVCSSCVQYFNLMTPRSRKLVRACPGSVTFAGAKRGVYYDVQPVRLSVSAGRH